MTAAGTAPTPRHGGGPGWRGRLRPFEGVWVAVLAAAALILTARGIRAYLDSRARAESTTEQAAARPDAVLTVTSDVRRDLTLPGGLIADQRTLVYARATGYVRRLRADIGDNVRAGQALVELDTPDLREELAQARAALVLHEATLDQAGAGQRYAHLYAAQQRSLAALRLVNAQVAEAAGTQALLADTNLTSAQENVRAERDLVHRLQALVSAGRVVAPFNGTVTKRFVEIGGLVRADAEATPLFEVEATDLLRAVLRVPERFASGVHAGLRAGVVVRQYPDHTFEATVARTANVLETTSRTLRTEIAVPNRSGALLPGMDCEVTLTLADPHPLARIPASALVFDSGGPHVATLGPDGRIEWVKVELGRYWGREVEIVDGLAGGERLLSASPADPARALPVDPVGL